MTRNDQHKATYKKLLRAANLRVEITRGKWENQAYDLVFTLIKSFPLRVDFKLRFPHHPSVLSLTVLYLAY